MRSASLGKKILCIFMVDFSIDPGAQALGPRLKEVDFPVHLNMHSGLERVKVKVTLTTTYSYGLRVFSKHRTICTVKDLIPRVDLGPNQSIRCSFFL